MNEHNGFTVVVIPHKISTLGHDIKQRASCMKQADYCINQQVGTRLHTGSFMKQKAGRNSGKHALHTLSFMHWREKNQMEIGWEIFNWLTGEKPVKLSYREVKKGW